MATKFEFKDHKEPPIGCGYGKYWSWILKSHGQQFFKNAVQAYWEELPEDPWGDGFPK